MIICNIWMYDFQYTVWFFSITINHYQLINQYHYNPWNIPNIIIGLQ